LPDAIEYVNCKTNDISSGSIYYHTSNNNLTVSIDCLEQLYDHFEERRFLCVHMYVNTKMIPVEISQEWRKRRLKESSGGG
jgi:hypothetical protein